MALFKITNPLYLANGKQKMFCMILAVSAAANIVMNIITIPRFGIIGAAMATAVSFFACGLAFYVKYLIGYRIKWYEPIFLRIDNIKVFVRKTKK